MNKIAQSLDIYRDDADAEFLGYQETNRGSAIPLYIVTARDHRLYGSTVSAETLRKNELRIPQEVTLEFAR